MNDRIMERNMIAQDWRMCCRLCAKEDMQTNIDVFLDGQDKISRVEHLFGICIRQSEDLPHMLCTECLTLLNALSTFTERVSKVQTMFRWLQEHDMSGHVNLSDARVKFGLFDEEREHLVFMQPITEVQCDESKPEEIELNADVQQQHQNGLEIIANDQVKLEEYLLEEVNEDMHDIVAAEEGDEEMAEDPFHSDENGDDATNKRQRQRKKVSRQTRKSTKRSAAATPAVAADTDHLACYQCTDCPRKFRRLRDYHMHLKRTHLKCVEKPKLQCDQCPRVFSVQSKLEIHVKTHIPLELKKVLPCPHCNKKFSSTAIMQSHINCIHMDLRPFICEECGMALRTKSSLNTHMTTHSDLKPFKCDVCSKSFKTKKLLKNHQEVHDPTKHICTDCGLQLNSRATLSRHMLVHSDEMNHKCDYCGRPFKRAKELKNHLIIHTGLKPFVCNFCDRTFANSSNCRSHKKKAHPDELAALEASGGKSYTRNIPKLDVLRALSKTADNLTPVVTKPSGCFASGRKPKIPPTKRANVKPSSKTNKPMEDG